MICSLEEICADILNVDEDLQESPTCMQERLQMSAVLALPTNPSWRISASELTDHLLPWVVGAPRSAKEHRPFSPTIRAYIFAFPRCE